MSRLPNPSADHAGLHTIDGGPAGAEAPPQPAQMPLIHSSGDEEQAVFLTDEQFMHDYLKEDHTVPLVTLLVCAGLTLCIYGYKGFAAGGIGAAVGMCIFAVILLAVAALTSTAAGWVVCKIFGEDYGSVGLLLLRFGAVAAVQFPVFEALTGLLGIVGLFVCVPVMIGVVMFVGGLDLIRAFLFIAILALVNWILIALLAVSVATAVA